MNKISKNKKGFTVVEALLIVLVIAVIGFGSYYVWHTQHTNKSTTTAKSATSTSTKTTTTTTVRITQLGIEVTVPNSIKDLTYSYRTSTTGFGNNEQLLIADLSTSSLTALDSNCAASNSTALGALGKANGTYPANSDVDGFVGQLVKQFPSFYVTWSNPQANCAFEGNNNTAADTLLTSQMQIVNSTFSSPSSVQLIN